MHPSLLLVHPTTFEISKSIPVAPSFSLFHEQCFHLLHPAFKNGTMLPFAHSLLFSLRYAVFPRILFVPLLSVWFAERLGSVKVKVPVFGVVVLVGDIRGTQCWVCSGVWQIARIKLIRKKFTDQLDPHVDFIASDQVDP